jgi:bromodomain-containing factor 1
MDLTTVQTKLGNNAYHEINEFKADVRLIFKNCYKFNGEGGDVNDCGHALEKVVNKKWDTKHDWISTRQPDSESGSVVEDSEEGDEIDAEYYRRVDHNHKISLLETHIEMMSKQMGGLKPKRNKRSTPPMS